MTNQRTDHPILRTFEAAQPWVIYTYPRTDAEAEELGALIIAQCAVCGVREEIGPLTLPPVGYEPPAGYKHPERIRFLSEHRHQPLPHVLTWALPLANPEAHKETLDVLEAVVRRAVEEADRVR